MDFSRWAPAGKAVPAPTCREMPAACLANIAEAERLEPAAQRAYLDACDAVRDYVESDGKAEKSKRAEAKRFWSDQVYRHQSGRRHWLIQLQAWRAALLRHPELANCLVGARCACGYIAPMCAVDRPVMKVATREPGSDDGDDEKGWTP